MNALATSAAGIAAALVLSLAPAPGAAAGGSAEAGVPGVAASLAQQVAERARQRGLAPEAALAPVAEAERRGLPAALVANKILEGLAKGAPPEQVLAVGRALVERLGEAARLAASAEQAGLRAPRDRATALADLAGALQDGVRADAVEALVEAARSAREGSDAVVAAARTLGELARRGVRDEVARPLGAALVRRGAGAAAQLASLHDAWRAEGGQDSARFAAEATRRLERGLPLDGLVDWFGESDDRLRGAPGDAAGEGATGSQGQASPGRVKDLAPGERADAAKGAVPGFDDAVRSRGKKKGPP